MSSNAVDVVLTHYREHGALPTTRYTRAYSYLSALRKAHDVGVLQNEDREKLDTLGAWTHRRAASHVRGGGSLRQEVVTAHAQAVIRYTKLNRQLPTCGAARTSLRYLRSRAQRLPAELVEQLDSLPVAWRPSAHQRFMNRLEEVIEWRAANHGRWPRGMNPNYNEGRHYLWLTYQGRSADPRRLAMLDDRLPGWRSHYA